MATTLWHKKALEFAPVLIVSSDRATANWISEVLRGFGPVPEMMWAGNADQAWRVLESAAAKLMFLERRGRMVDGLGLTRQLRRSSLACRQVPVIMLSDEATVGALRDAQSAGASEFLVRPFSSLDLGRRLDAICAGHRLWIETETYIGPDRRRFNSAIKGPDRRGRKLR
jgi:DNA-binding response OmpR family regulator